MAKRKSNDSKPSTSSRSKSNRSPSGNSASSASATKAAPQGLEISPIAIGHAAGEIWALLSTNGEQTLAAIKKSVDAPSDIVLAAIGWLAREDKLDFTATGRTVKISLR